MNNPWLDIENNCYKRITRDLNLFYAKSLDDDYLLIIELDDVPINDRNLSLKGFELYQNEENGKYKIYLKLKEQGSWEIFYQLCNDLVSYIQTSKYPIDKTVINRLMTWQSFLSSENNSFPLEKQLGLMGELTFLYEILTPKASLKQALIAWVGPEKEKQDFRINDVNIEVKAYLDNKSNKVHISSLEQLNPESGSLYLYAFGFRILDNGITVKDYISKIKSSIMEQCPEELFDFEQLILAYGYNYIQEYDNLERLYRYDANCWKVENNFPRIPIDIKNDAISSVLYTINLALCNDFEKQDSDLLAEIKRGGADVYP